MTIQLQSSLSPSDPYHVVPDGDENPVRKFVVPTSAAQLPRTDKTLWDGYKAPVNTISYPWMAIIHCWGATREAEQFKKVLNTAISVLVLFQNSALAATDLD